MLRASEREEKGKFSQFFFFCFCFRLQNIQNLPIFYYFLCVIFFDIKQEEIFSIFQFVLLLLLFLLEFLYYENGFIRQSLLLLQLFDIFCLRFSTFSMYIHRKTPYIYIIGSSVHFQFFNIFFFFLYIYSQENSEFLQLNQNQLHQSSVNVGYSNIVYNPNSSSSSRSRDNTATTAAGIEGKNYFRNFEKVIFF